MDNTNEPQTEQDSQPTEEELTDEQLLQLAEGSCTWGANCGK